MTSLRPAYGAILMFGSFTSFAHLTTSSASSCRISSTLPVRTSSPVTYRHAHTSGVGTAYLMAVSIALTTSFGVPAGAKNPIQVLTS